MGFLMPKAPTIAPPPPPPPPPPVRPAEPVRSQESALKKKLSDPSRVGRAQTIVSGPRGVMSEDDTTTSRSLLKGKRDAQASN